MLGRRSFLRIVGNGSVGLSALGFSAGSREGRPSWRPGEVMVEDDFWRMVRRQYPLTEERVYLNTGGLGPAPYSVLDATQRVVQELQSVSETGHAYLDEARGPVASFFGVRPVEIAFMRNATEANSTVASGLIPLQPGDEVIFESHAHPGGSIPWLSRQKQQGIRVKIFEPDPTSAAGNLERIEDLITPQTRVIQVSHVTAPTGILLPVAEIARLAHDRGLWFHVDGAQSAGMLPVNLHEMDCDSYATSGHKWMGAPHGTGLLYVKEARLDDVAPTEVGAYSDDGYDLPDRFDYHPSARRYEPGTRDASRVMGFLAAVRFMEDIGIERVAAYGKQLSLRLQAGLREIEGVTVLTPEDPLLSGSMTTFKTDRVPYDRLFAYLLNEHQLRCRVVTERDLNALRVSTHIFNSARDCDRVIDATRAAIKQA